MLTQLQMQEREPTLLAKAYVWFLRAMAVICITSTIVCWAQLLGITSNGEWRFDLVEPKWRIALTVLAILLPAASLGLWLLQTWGVLLWVIASGMEILIYGVYSDIYMPRINLVIAHTCFLIVFSVLAIALFLQHRKAQATQL